MMPQYGIAAEVLDRLEERDRNENGSWEKPEDPSLDEKISDHRRDEEGRLGETISAYYQEQARAPVRERVMPSCPPSPKKNATLRDELSHATTFLSQPLVGRQHEAANLNELAARRETLKELGFDPDKAGPADMRAITDGLAGQTQAAGSDLGGVVMAQLDADPASTVKLLADSYNVPVIVDPQAVQTHQAVVEGLNTDPIGTIGWLAHQAGVHPGHLIEAITPGMTRYHALAERSGTDLVSALDRYTAAERWLEEDPRAGIKWLCRNYGIDPRTL